MTMKREGLPYEEMGYCPPPNRKLPPVPPPQGAAANSNYNTIDRIKNGKIPIAVFNWSEGFIFSYNLQSD